MNPASHESPNGILLLRKAEGPTSADCLRVLKRTLGKKAKIGHAGTLDPMATGLLVVLLGPSTRLADVVMEGEKRYDGIFRFGVTTETDDRDGKILVEKPIDALTPEAIDALLPRFTGKIQQRPPQYAAVKIEGKRAYERARAGEAFEIPPREVEIHEIRRADWNPPLARFLVRTGKGAYLRSLARDLGEMLGVGGHVHALERTGVGPFDVAHGVSPEEITRENLHEHLLSPGTVFEGLPRFVVSASGARALVRGRIPRADEFVERPKEPLNARAGVFDESGRLIASCRIGPVGTLSDRRVLEE